MEIDCTMLTDPNINMVLWIMNNCNALSVLRYCIYPDVVCNYTLMIQLSKPNISSRRGLCRGFCIPFEFPDFIVRAKITS